MLAIGHPLGCLCRNQFLPQLHAGDHGSWVVSYLATPSAECVPAASTSIICSWLARHTLRPWPWPMESDSAFLSTSLGVLCTYWNLRNSGQQQHSGWLGGVGEFQWFLILPHIKGIWEAYRKYLCLGPIPWEYIWLGLSTWDFDFISLRWGLDNCSILQNLIRQLLYVASHKNNGHLYLM